MVSCSPEGAPAARRHDFAAGQAPLPQPVLRQVQRDILDWQGHGRSVLDLAFTTEDFRGIARRAQESLSRLLKLPPAYHVLFLQGGAYAHFALTAMNLMGRVRSADYVITGHWSSRAASEAARYGVVRIAATAAPFGFCRIPRECEWRLDPSAAYCHLTSNETANGLQFHWTPESAAVPLVADLTSDFLTRPLDIAKYGLVYASAQKNAGIAGLTVVIVRDDLLERALDTTPLVFNYGQQAQDGSRVNTPPTFGVYVAALMFEWMEAAGGLAVLGDAGRRKAATIYGVIDQDDYYRCPVLPADRSQVSICFRLPRPADEQDFLAEAARNGLCNLQGHTLRGGIRACLYNAVTDEDAEALAAFMQYFSRRRRSGRRSRHLS